MNESKKRQFKNFLAEKEKVVANSPTYNSGGNNGEKKQVTYLPFFSPTKLLTVRRTETITVKVLPGKDNFFYEYSKHMCKVDDTFKQAICFGDECPICRFLDSNEDIDRKTKWLLSAKKVYLMFVYNPYAKQIMKYEVQEPGLVELLKAVRDKIDEDDDFDPDLDGFDISFRLDGKYAIVDSVKTSDKTLDEVLSEATNIETAVNANGELKELSAEAMPYSVKTTKKYVNTTAQQMIGRLLPGFDIEPFLYDENELKYDKEPEPPTDDPDDESIVSVDDIVAPSDNPTEDDDSEDIRDFLRKHNNRR